MDAFETIRLDDEQNAVIILDQTQLPHQEKYLTLFSIESVWDAIKALKVRGAPAIGIAAAMGIYIHMKQSSASTYDAFYKEFSDARDYLASSRPTAVNLCWALDRMAGVVVSHKDKTVSAIKTLLRETAELIKTEDIDVCRSIGEHGAPLISPGMGILTHCNAGALATARYGTALAPVYLAHAQGVPLKVFADETRPLLQGARLTAYELHRSGVDVTLICDNMASIVMQKGWINAVFVGCDRVAANGDTANKIGTSGVAILAAAYGIPFYVCAPVSTIDLDCPSGSDIIIEERDDAEVTTMWYDKRMSPDGIKVYNPAFDVTPARYITAFITERGIVRPPFEPGLRLL